MRKFFVQTIFRTLSSSRRLFFQPIHTQIDPHDEYDMQREHPICINVNDKDIIKRSQ